MTFKKYAIGKLDFQKLVWPTSCDIPRQITSDMRSFDFDDIKNESSIAKGGCGFVYKATIKNQTVVVKKLQASLPRMRNKSRNK